MAAFPEGFCDHARRLGLVGGVDPATELARPLLVGDRPLANRLCALPMEGWDADSAGGPTALTLERWRKYGASGAALIWGEAVAVMPQGRAHGQQLLATRENLSGLAALVAACRGAAVADDLLIGLQLNHAGRFSKPAPRPVWQDPWLDERTGLASGLELVSDAELEEIISAFVEAGKLAAAAGFDFVDIKLCHLYLGHELLCARNRQGAYGGDLAGRSKFFFAVVEQLKAVAPELKIASRLSLFEPTAAPPGTVGAAPPFGAELNNPWQLDLGEPIELVGMMAAAGVELLCTTIGSPYTTPHLVRPAKRPAPGDPPPPESYLDGAARHLELAGIIKRHHPQMVITAPGITPLETAGPLVAAAAIASGLIDLAGLGRGLLACPTWPREILSHTPPGAKDLCSMCAQCTAKARQNKPATCSKNKLKPHKKT